MSASFNKFCKLLKNINITFHEISDTTCGWQGKFIRQYTHDKNNRFIIVTNTHSDNLSTFKRKTKHSVRYNIYDVEYVNSFIPKPVLRPEYRTLFQYPGFLWQDLYCIYLFYSFAIAKNIDLHLDPLLPADCGTVGNKYSVNI